jgi:hypothetical protein
MQKLTHQHFRLGILTPNARHIITARFLIVYIGHSVKLNNIFGVWFGATRAKVIPKFLCQVSW